MKNEKKSVAVDPAGGAHTRGDREYLRDAVLPPGRGVVHGHLPEHLSADGRGHHLGRAAMAPLPPGRHLGLGALGHLRGAARRRRHRHRSDFVPLGINSPCCPAWRLFAIDHPPGRVIFSCFIKLAFPYYIYYFTFCFQLIVIYNCDLLSMIDGDPTVRSDS